MKASWCWNFFMAGGCWNSVGRTFWNPFFLNLCCYLSYVTDYRWYSIFGIYWVFATAKTLPMLFSVIVFFRWFRDISFFLHFQVRSLGSQERYQSCFVVESLTGVFCPNARHFTSFFAGTTRGKYFILVLATSSIILYKRSCSLSCAAHKRGVLSS